MDQVIASSGIVIELKHFIVPSDLLYHLNIQDANQSISSSCEDNIKARRIGHESRCFCTGEEEHDEFVLPSLESIHLSDVNSVLEGSTVDDRIQSIIFILSVKG